MILRAFFFPPQGTALEPIVVVNVQNYYGKNEFAEITEGRRDEAPEMTARLF